MAKELTKKQKRFCLEYLIDLNGKQAAIRAGYSEKTAAAQASRFLGSPAIARELKSLLEQKSGELIATSDETLRYLTSVLRGESESTEIAVVGTGDGCSEAVLVSKNPTEKERLKAAELLGKYHALYTEKSEINAEIAPVVLRDDISE